jgi:hypothetical protein
MDLATLKEHAARARRLAKHADPFTKRRLLDLAREYEAQIETIQRTEVTIIGLARGTTPAHSPNA